MDSKKRKAEEATEDSSVASEEPKLGPEDALKLLEPLSKEQLAEIVSAALLRHETVLDKVREIVDQDTNNRKLFVRGLGPESKAEALKAAFAQFGPIKETMVMKDKNTGKSKGYGFVTFKHADSALLALKNPSKRVEGRKTVSTIATAGAGASHSYPDQTGRKIYIGNIPLNTSSDKLLDLFEEYGEVEEGPLGLDKPAGKTNKCFALIIYKSEEAAQRALEEPSKTIDGHKIFCKYAENTSRQKNSAGQGVLESSILPSSDAGHNKYNNTSANPSTYSSGLQYSTGGNPSLGLGGYSHLSSPGLVSSSALNSSVGHHSNPAMSSLHSSHGFSPSLGSDNPASGGISSNNYSSLGSHLGSSRSYQMPYSGGISTSLYGREENPSALSRSGPPSGAGDSQSLGYNSNNNSHQYPYSGGVSSSLYGREESASVPSRTGPPLGAGASQQSLGYNNSEVPRPGDWGPPLSSYYRR